MISFLKQYFIGEKNIGIFQSFMLILFLLAFFFVIFFVLSKSKKYYNKISLIPLEVEELEKNDKKRKSYEI
ncbi:CcoQ/FixQ family Cbb3-type cytochrome c oxidase assembly chaperone [Blattabacterium sp. (Blaberus giganteus)]|uniref:CcoQ/FixQ family Cbb3-type cytochrome c oxidase assembly chaperone n=1 Tax=Blattabacterium sp. (Blaberus giganteus) TaxID=1186051 RepID=UPI0002EAA555|nr:CcoQ/FixQ family Cbb3-type cytochrome c oxidase assembly chaperone [Blattabacterium sp. (Blaberus giganteus)]